MKKTILLAAAVLVALPSIAMAEDGWGTPEVAKEAPKVQTDAEGKACGQDDPRLANIVPVLKDVRAGKAINPIKISFGSYMDLSKKARDILGDNIILTTPSCKDQVLFEGELTSKVQIPFPMALNLIDQALQQRDKAKLEFIFKNAQAEAASTHDIMYYSMARAYPIATGKVLVQIGNLNPIASNDTEMGIITLSLFAALGGKLAAGETNQINVYAYNSSYAASQVYTDEKHMVKIAEQSEKVYSPDHLERPITGYLAKKLAGIYASIGVNARLTDDEVR